MIFLLSCLSLFVWNSLSSSTIHDQTYSVSCTSHPKLFPRHPSYSRSSATSSCQLIPGHVPYTKNEKSSSAETHAYGTYVDTVKKDGWGKLWIHSDNSSNAYYQAGFLEGSLTSLQIYQHYISWYSYQFSSSPPSNNTIQFLLDQYEFTLQLIETSDSADPYYQTLSNIMNQFHGILDGINYSAQDNSQTMTLIDLLLLEASGDLYDIIPAVDPELFDLHINKISSIEFFDRWHSKVSCSALIKIPSDNSDVYASHTTWTSYQNMLRIYKHYNLDNGHYKSSHSSKPGMIYSKDDFYVLPNTKLVVMETTNGVINEELYQAVTFKSLLTWQRIPLCNTLANNGQEWVNLVAKYNSGTYANQWMVLDMKLFQKGSGVTSLNNFLWIIELAPGLAISKDVTQVMLQQDGYWPSYNVPYTKEMYKLSGFQAAYEAYGDEYSYEQCTRAKIFARNHSLVQSYDQMKHLLRYNDYLNDPLSGGNAALAISARYDLRSSNVKSYGGVDTKITSFTRIMKDESGEDMLALSSAECGPTHDNLPPFKWSTSEFNSQIHEGQPDEFNFHFVEMDYYLH